MSSVALLYALIHSGNCNRVTQAGAPHRTSTHALPATLQTGPLLKLCVSSKEGSGSRPLAPYH